MSQARFSRLQVLGAAALFSTGGAAIKAVSLSAWQVTGFRSGLAALVLLLALPGRREWWRPRCLFVGLAYAATLTLYVTANKLTTAANTIFLQSTAPLYLLLLGPWLLGERNRRRDLVFAATIAVGLGLFFVGVEPPQRTAPDPVSGNVVGAVCGLLWALTMLGLRWLARDDAREGGNRVGGAVIAGNLIAFCAAAPMAFPLRAGPVDVAVLVYLGVFQIGLAYVWLTRAVREIPALEASLLLLLEPVLNAVWAWWIHGERPGSWSLAGCAVILGATLAQVLGQRR